MCGHFIITPELMTVGKRKMVVMHPLPRVDEIRSVCAGVSGIEMFSVHVCEWNLNV